MQGPRVPCSEARPFECLTHSKVPYALLCAMTRLLVLYFFELRVGRHMECFERFNRKCRLVQTAQRFFKWNCRVLVCSIPFLQRTILGCTPTMIHGWSRAKIFVQIASGCVLFTPVFSHMSYTWGILACDSHDHGIMEPYRAYGSPSSYPRFTRSWHDDNSWHKWGLWQSQIFLWWAWHASTIIHGSHLLTWSWQKSHMSICM